MENYNRIKMVREEKGLSLTELADLIGKGRSTVFRYEAGQVPIEMVQVLAGVLEVSPAYLMGWSDSRVLDVISVPIVTNVINGEFIIEGYVDIPTRNTIKGKLSFYRVEEAMRPYLIEDAMVLASDDTNAEDGGLVVILPDNSNTPLVRIIKYEGENILFIASDRFSKIYTTDDATVLGDVISVTYTYKNI